MAHLPLPPFTTKVLESQKGDTSDDLPALYHSATELGTAVENPCENMARFLQSELSFGDASDTLDDLVSSEPKRPPLQMHIYVSLGLEFLVVDRMALHLIWTDHGILLKPIPRFLLDPGFWSTELQCPPSCACDTTAQLVVQAATGPSCLMKVREIALGFLYTYACLVSSENDFAIANDKRLLPRMPDDSAIRWEAWKKLVRELQHTHDPDKIHPRFLWAELEFHHHLRPLWRPQLQIIKRRSRHNATGSAVFGMTAAAVITALILTAMQVGLATEWLQGDKIFQDASAFFAIWAMLIVVVGSPIVMSLFYWVWRDKHR